MIALEVVERQSGRILKGGFAEAKLMPHVACLKIDRIQYSTLDVRCWTFFSFFSKQPERFGPAAVLM